MSLQRVIETTKNRLVGSNNIIKRFYKISYWNDEPKFFQFATELNLEKFGINYLGKYTNGLSYFDENLAKIRALGEGIERFALARYSIESLLFGSTREFCSKGLNILDPKLFLTFEKKVSKNLLVNDESKIGWVKGKHLFKNNTILIPAQLVFVPYREDEPLIRLPITSGAAAHTSNAGVLYKGISELIERDSFMIYWLNMLPPLKLEIESLNIGYLNTLLKIFQRYFLEWHVFFLKTDIPTWNILSLLIDESNNGPFLSVGLSSDFSLTDAILHSAEEAQMGRFFVRSVLFEKKEKKINPHKISTHEERGIFWAKKSKRLIKSINFLFEGKKIKIKNKKTFSSSEKYFLILKYLRNEKIPCFYVDIMKINVHHKIKWYIKKVISPYFCPLHLDERYRYLTHPRIYEVSKKLGFEEKNESDLNKLPHPFL